MSQRTNPKRVCVSSSISSSQEGFFRSGHLGERGALVFRGQGDGGLHDVLFHVPDPHRPVPGACREVLSVLIKGQRCDRQVVKALRDTRYGLSLPGEAEEASPPRCYAPMSEETSASRCYAPMSE